MGIAKLSSADPYEERGRSCQIQCVPGVSEGRDPIPGLSPLQWARLVLKRTLGTKTKRALKARFSALTRIVKPAIESEAAPARADTAPAPLVAGDRVRVRSEDEIRATLDSWGQLRGCAFFGEMKPYCGRTMRVLKPVTRFVDERDYQVKKARGLVLLENAICEGTGFYGKCDRSCFFFWRVEWLEKLGPDASGPAACAGDTVAKTL